MLLLLYLVFSVRPEGFLPEPIWMLCVAVVSCALLVRILDLLVNWRETAPKERWRRVRSMMLF